MNFFTIGKAHLWKVKQTKLCISGFSKLIKGISEIKEPLENLKIDILKNLPKTLIKRVVLFGSIAKGSEKPDSDIDIFILVKNKQDSEKLEISLEKLSNICLEVYGNRLSPYILTEKELKQKERLKVISEINRGLQIFP